MINLPSEFTELLNKGVIIAIGECSFLKNNYYIHLLMRMIEACAETVTVIEGNGCEVQ